MESSSSDSDIEDIQRSQALFYRSEGSRAKRFRYQSSSSSSDQDHHQGHHADDEPIANDAPDEDNNGNAVDESTASDDVDEPSEDLTCNAVDELIANDDVDERNKFNNSNDVESDDGETDSQWSEDLDNHFIEEDSGPDNDYDPFLEEEEERDHIILENHGDPIALSSDESDNEEDNFNFGHEKLSTELEFSQSRTAKESLLLHLASSVRHSLTYECLMQLLQNQNFLLGTKTLPSSKKELWKVLGQNNSGVTFYAYCKKCSSLIGKKQNIQEFAVCPECSESTRKENASYFVSLSIKKQLEYFLALPEAAHLLGYRERRNKISGEADIEDIFDGAEYKKIRVEGKELFNSDNYTYVANTDGCKFKKGGKLSIYPIFVRINELPPGMRQKFMFIAGIFVDRKEPNMVTFLHPFVKQMNRLATRGVVWKKNGEDVTSRFVVTCVCVDGKARSQVLNMAQHGSHFGCTYCTYYGVSSNGTIRYPTEHPDLPPYAERTDAGMRKDMIEAETQPGNDTVRGHKGITPLADLKYFDLAKGNASDDLHSVFECAAVHHTEILIKEVPKVDKMGEKPLLRIINARLKAIKVPSCIARTAGSTTFENRGQMHGTDWRNWLWFFACICLFGLIATSHIQHLERLSHATYLLSMDIIKPGDIDHADKLIQEYLSLYYETFGIDKTRRNLHELSHAPNCVRAWGAYWCYTTFNFESWNHQLMQLVKAAKGALQQMVSRHLIHMILALAQFATDIAQDVKDQISKILNKKKHKNAIQVGTSSYLLGKSTNRVPSPEEARVLALEKVETDNLTVFDKALIGSTRYTTARYSLRHEESRIDDSSIFTHQNTFCTIQDVVRFTTRDGRDVHGLLVLEHEVVKRPRPVFPIAKHICEVQHTGGLLHLISFDQVRVPVVKAPLLGDMFFIPVPNLNQID